MQITNVILYFTNVKKIWQPFQNTETWILLKFD